MEYFRSPNTLCNMRRLLFLGLLLIAPICAEELSKHFNLSDSALGGFDPVSYFQNRPAKGDEKWTATLGGVHFFFASSENRETFNSDPEKYLPAYGGWCAYAMLDGDKVEVDPLSYKIIGGKNYLFYNGFWGDTLKRWNKKLPKTPEAKLVGQADKEWKTIVSE